MNSVAVAEAAMVHMPLSLRIQILLPAACLAIAELCSSHRTGARVGIASLGVLLTIAVPLAPLSKLSCGTLYDVALRQDTTFSMLQLHGWILVGGVGGIATICCVNIGVSVVGVFGIDAMLALFADFILCYSLRFYRSPAKTAPASPGTKLRLETLQALPQRLPSVLALAGFACSLVCEALIFRAPAVAHGALIALTVLMLAAALCTHLGGTARISGYGFWQPFHGGAPFVLLQAEAWMLLAGSLNFCLSTIRMPNKLAQNVVPGVVGLFGGLQLLANALLIVSLPLFRQEASARAREVIRPEGAVKPVPMAIWLTGAAAIAAACVIAAATCAIAAAASVIAAASAFTIAAASASASASDADADAVLSAATASATAFSALTSAAAAALCRAFCPCSVCFCVVGG